MSVDNFNRPESEINTSLNFRKVNLKNDTLFIFSCLSNKSKNLTLWFQDFLLNFFFSNQNLVLEVRVVKLSTISAKVLKFTYSIKVLNSLALGQDSHVFNMLHQKLIYLGLIGLIRSLLFKAKSLRHYFNTFNTRVGFALILLLCTQIPCSTWVNLTKIILSLIFCRCPGPDYHTGWAWPRWKSFVCKVKKL